MTGGQGRVLGVLQGLGCLTKRGVKLMMLKVRLGEGMEAKIFEVKYGLGLLACF